MSNCNSCGAERRLIGVLYPARRLCSCEQRRCARCAAPAMVVEFQAPIEGRELSLPVASNGVAMFYCDGHAPSAPGAGGSRSHSKKRGKARAHIDPQWQNTYPERPPAGAGSRRPVECCGCKDVHELRDRCMHNGTRSECPRCGEVMFTDAWDDAA